MAIPKKPVKKEDPSKFIGAAKATVADTKSKPITMKGRPSGPKKGQFPVRLPIDLLDTIKRNAAGNVTFFTEQVFRDYFESRGISIFADEE